MAIRARSSRTRATSRRAHRVARAAARSRGARSQAGEARARGGGEHGDALGLGGAGRNERARAPQDDAALRVGNTYVGATRRAPSFPSNTWECPVRRTDRNTTYFIPLTPDMIGQELEVVVLNLGSRRYAWEKTIGTKVDLQPEVWITAYPAPCKRVMLR
jgi:hypothetical protein